MRPILSCFRLLLLLGPLTVGAQEAPPMPRVVELFTSQGCSSCPPADALLGELTRRGDVLALAYHVDYWDGLGWKDPFSLAEATRRQRVYAQTWGTGRVYTPQMVIGGTADVVGSDRQAVLSALSARRDGMGLQIALDGAVVTVQAAAALPAAADWLAVSYSGTVETKVTRGENAGRRLMEYAIVRSLHPMAPTGDLQRRQLDLRALPATATDLAVLVQEHGQGRILAAGSLRLPIR